MRTAMTHYCAGSLALFLWAAVVVQPASAEGPICYKFAQGQKLRYTTTQKIKMSIQQGDKPLMEPTTDVMTDMVWEVKEVKEDGSAVIDQTTTRFQIKTTGMSGQEFEIDSASEQEPAGPIAKTLAPMLKTMIGEPFRVTMTSRGQLTDVQIPDKVTESLKKSPIAGQIGELFTKEGFKKTIQQGSIVFPEGDLTIGQEWTSKFEAKNPAFGGIQTVETKYRYEGQEKIQDRMLEKFSIEMKLDFGKIADGPLSAMISMGDQESNGTIYFDREAGRMKSAETYLKMNMKITAGEQTTNMRMDMNISVVVEPQQ